MERARWEAKLRMLESARRMGAGEVWNVRFETSNIRSSNRNSPAVSVEVFAFGTAVVIAFDRWWHSRWPGLGDKSAIASGGAK